MDPFSIFLMAMAGGGKIFEGLAGSRAATMNRQIAADNLALMQIQAKASREESLFAYERGGYEQAKLHRQIDATIGSQTAYFAGNNMDPGYGSPLLLAARTQVQGETDSQLIYANSIAESARALSKAAGFEAQGLNAAWQMTAAEEKARNSLISGFLGAGTAMLTTVGKGGFKPGGGGSNDFGMIGPGAGNPFILNQPTDI